MDTRQGTLNITRLMILDSDLYFTIGDEYYRLPIELKKMKKIDHKFLIATGEKETTTNG